MTLSTDIQQCDGQMLKSLFIAGVNWLAAHENEINSMNVFPVPDGDTGSNMLATVRQAQEQMQAITENHVGLILDSIAQGALRGARGNSGTILSMTFRGFANALKDEDVLDAAGFVRGLQSAVAYAYETVRSVMEPVEGTILTVARETAEAVQAFNSPDVTLRELLDEAVRSARGSVERTPELLPVLKQANVVDSGGLGLAYFLEGFQRGVEGKSVVVATTDDAVASHGKLDNVTRNAWESVLIPEDKEGYGYDVQFLMLGENLNVRQVRQDMSAMGWSPLVDGSDSMIKVHIHVHNPGEPLNYAIQSGAELDDVVVENMQLQYQQYVSDRQNREADGQKQIAGVAVITVAHGEGLRQVFEEYHASRIIVGGQTMNPSTDDFLKAIDSLANDEIILLPNNKNILLAAQQAATQVSDKQVRIVPSRNIPQGVAALLVYGDLNGGGDSLDTIVENMTDALDEVDCCEITIATRDAEIDGVFVKEGQVIGLLNGVLVSAGDDYVSVIRSIFRAAEVDESEIATFYVGEQISADDAQAIVNEIEEDFDHVEFEIIDGGQALYPFIISIE